MKNIDNVLQQYQSEIQKKKIVQAYQFLQRFMMKARADFGSHYKGEYKVGHIAPGYLDYSYFSFFDAELRAKNLRCGIVLNHAALRIEFWLLGQNVKVHKDYWTKLKKTPWNAHRTTPPQYAILEAVLVEQPDFNKEEELLLDIRTQAIQLVRDIKPLL